MKNESLASAAAAASERVRFSSCRRVSCRKGFIEVEEEQEQEEEHATHAAVAKVKSEQFDK